MIEHRLFSPDTHTVRLHVLSPFFDLIRIQYLDDYDFSCAVRKVEL